METQSIFVYELMADMENGAHVVSLAVAEANIDTVLTQHHNMTVHHVWVTVLNHVLKSLAKVTIYLIHNTLSDIIVAQ